MNSKQKSEFQITNKCCRIIYPYFYGLFSLLLIFVLSISFSSNAHAQSSLSFGDQFVFADSGTRNVTVAKLDSTRFVVAYRDVNNSNHGVAVIGTVSGMEISYGAKYVFNSGSVGSVFVASLDSNRFVVAYNNSTDINNQYGAAVVGTVSGTTISYGDEFQFNDRTSLSISVDALSPTLFVVAFRDIDRTNEGIVRVGSVPGSSISWGYKRTFNTGQTLTPSVVALDTDKIVLVYRDQANSAYGRARVGTISYPSIFLGAEYTFNADRTLLGGTSESTRKAVALDANRFAVIYDVIDYNPYGVHGEVIIGTISGTTISYGNKYIVDDPNYPYTNLVTLASLDSSHLIVGYLNSGYDGRYVLLLEVSGTSISLLDTKVRDPGNSSSNSVVSFDSTTFVFGIGGVGSAASGSGQVGKVVPVPICNSLTSDLGTYIPSSGRPLMTADITNATWYVWDASGGQWFDGTGGGTVHTETADNWRYWDPDGPADGLPDGPGDYTLSVIGQEGSNSCQMNKSVRVYRGVQGYAYDPVPNHCGAAGAEMKTQVVGLGDDPSSVPVDAVIRVFDWPTGNPPQPVMADIPLKRWEATQPWESGIVAVWDHPGSFSGDKRYAVVPKDFCEDGYAGCDGSLTNEFATVGYPAQSLVQFGYCEPNQPPGPPTSLLTNNQVNPTGLTGIPFFSAIYNDPDSSDTANRYRTQVDDNSNFSSPIWDSGDMAMSNCTQGNRCQDISYNGAALTPGVRYYWRIQYRDIGGLWGGWSTEVAYFEMDGSGTLTGYVWNDEDGDCNRVAGEANYYNTSNPATMKLQQGGSDVATFNTDSTSSPGNNFTVSSIPYGTYDLVFIPPSSWRATTNTQVSVTINPGEVTTAVPQCP